MAVLAVAAVTGVRATSVRPPSFAELVDGSPLVFRGEVTATRVEWTGDFVHRHPATVVTFAVERVLKGEAGATITLEFIGGAIGTRRLEIAGLPSFTIGQRGVFFVENRRSHLCPLMRLRYGQYRIVRAPGSGTERVLRADGSPLRSPAGVQAALSDSGPAATAAAGAVGLAQFEDAVVARAQHGSPSPAQAR